MDSKKTTPKPAARPVPKSAKPSPKPTGKSSVPSKKAVQPTSFMNWLGRQVGHVTSAVKTDVTKPASRPTGAKAAPGNAGGKSRDKVTPGAAAAGPRQPSASPTSPAGGMVIYREDKVEEAEMPDRPGVILRRTIIDEVVVETPIAPPPQQPTPGATPGQHPRQ